MADEIPDAATPLLSAFRKLFGNRDYRLNVYPNGKAFTAWNVERQLQWNADYDPEEKCAKFGINVEQKDTVRSLFENPSSTFQAELAEALFQLPDGIMLRIYEHASRRGRRLIIFEKQANDVDRRRLQSALERMQDLLGFPGYPKPHFHLYGEIWKRGQPLTRSHFLEKMQSLNQALENVMSLLLSQIRQ